MAGYLAGWLYGWLWLSGSVLLSRCLSRCLSVCLSGWLAMHGSDWLAGWQSDSQTADGQLARVSQSQSTSVCLLVWLALWRLLAGWIFPMHKYDAPSYFYNWLSLCLSVRLSVCWLAVWQSVFIQ
jgi:hypothetical protein